MPTTVSEVAEFIESTEALKSDLGVALQTYPQENCVRLPFHSAHRADAGETPSKPQQALIPWRHRLADRNQRLRAYFSFLGRADLIDLFPLAGFGHEINFGYEITAELCLKLLDREIDLLQRERRRVATPPAETPMPNLIPPNLTDEQAVLLRQIVDVYRSGCTEPFIFNKLLSGDASLIYSGHPNVSVDADEVDLDHLRDQGLITLSKAQGNVRGKPTKQGLQVFEK
jgi:hypothetical protein